MQVDQNIDNLHAEVFARGEQKWSNGTICCILQGEAVVSKSTQTSEDEHKHELKIITAQL